MTSKQDEAIASGAAHVDQSEQLEHHVSGGRDVGALEVNEEDANAPEQAAVKTDLPGMTLSVFAQKGGDAGKVRVRVGNAHNAAELYEAIFDSADEANSALLNAGLLTPEQVPDINEPAGTGIELPTITAEQLGEAGLRRHGGSTL